MSKYILKITIFICTLFLFEGALSNDCISKQTCQECITENYKCAWCLQENLSDNDAPMCDHRENLEKRSCKIIVDPKNSLIKLKDVRLSDKVAKESEAIQVKPQAINIQLRPNSVQKFHVEYRQTVDYPVDLYYLMDLSNSMLDDKMKLAELGNKLADEMGEITKNFRLGFGSFVDKTVAPFVSSHEDKLREPCPGCASPYGYRNNMPLSMQTHEFASKVKEAPISGNIDAPEGGFDAIMQAIVCKEEIGWRNNSRKLLVYSSDNSYHYAGDGKLGGVVTPNDGSCHLDEKGLYTMSNELDYPSVSQINRKIREHKINLIFAVTREQTSLYQKLSRRITGSSTGTLDNDSANVVDLVRQQYDKIQSSVEMTDDVVDNNIKLTYYSKCLGSKKEKTNFCRGLKVETNVTFEVELEFASCPADRKQWKRSFHIFPVGLQDLLRVNLEMLCECDCEKPGNDIAQKRKEVWNMRDSCGNRTMRLSCYHKEPNSPKCSNGNGTFECGICRCNPNRYGKECECDASQTDSFQEDTGCFNGNDTKPCSGFGTCLCGQCYCHHRQNPEEIIYGKFCECNNFSCDRNDDKLCSGSDHGTCECGKCRCNSGWTGEDCSCKVSEEECLDKEGKLCNDHGACVCGECKCEMIEGKAFYGTHCDDCATCDGKCNELKPCVECRLQNQTCESCGTLTVVPVDKIEVSENENLCTFEDKENCTISFKYALDKENHPVVSIQI